MPFPVMFPEHQLKFMKDMIDILQQLSQEFQQLRFELSVKCINPLPHYLMPF